MTYLDDGAFAQHVVIAAAFTLRGTAAAICGAQPEGLQGLFATERRWSRESPAGPERTGYRAQAIATINGRSRP